MSAANDSGARVVVQPRILALLRPGVAYGTAGIAQALGVTRAAARQALDRLTEKGAIARRKVGIDCVYFATQACADAWGAEEAAEFARAQQAKRATALAASHRRLGQRLARAAKDAARRAQAAEREQRARSNASQPAPVVVSPRPAWRDTPADMSRARITRAPAPVDSRYYVDPQSIEPGAFVLRDAGPRWSDYAVRRAER